MSTRNYFILVALITTLVALWSGIFGFDDTTKYLLKFHHSWLDTIFSRITLWGEWPMVVVTLFFSVLLFRWKSWPFFLAFAAEGLITQGLKLWFNLPRPSVKFPELMRHIDGVKLVQWKAFPSGHTAAAFFGTGIIIYILDKLETPKSLSISIVFLAFLVGYSRIYLGQHSIEDVLSGAFLGSLLSFVFLFYFDRTNAAKLA
jgi:membrane-associated phospholipid phosphatase